MFSWQLGVWYVHSVPDIETYLHVYTVDIHEVCYCWDPSVSLATSSETKTLRWVDIAEVDFTQGYSFLYTSSPAETRLLFSRREKSIFTSRGVFLTLGTLDARAWAWADRCRRLGNKHKPCVYTSPAENAATLSWERGGGSLTIMDWFWP